MSDRREPPPSTPVPRLVAAFLSHAATNAEADFWAWEEVDQRTREPGDAQDAWALVLALIEQASDDLLDIVAAGPLENLVAAFAPALIERIEAQAAQDATFRCCLEMVWLGVGDLPADIEERVIKASGGRIRPLGPPHRRHGA
jgi:hypothetical protein